MKVNVVLLVVFAVLVGLILYGSYSKRGVDGPSHLFPKLKKAAPPKEWNKPHKKTWKPEPKTITRFVLRELGMNGEVVAEFCLPDLDNSTIPAHSYINVVPLENGVAEQRPCVKNIFLKPFYDQDMDVTLTMPSRRALMIFKTNAGEVCVVPGDPTKAYVGTGSHRRPFSQKQRIETLLCQIIVIGGVRLSIVKNDLDISDIHPKNSPVEAPVDDLAMLFEK